MINVIRVLLNLFSLCYVPLQHYYFLTSVIKASLLITPIYFPLMASWLLLEFLFSTIVPPLFAMYVAGVSSSPCVSILRGTLG